MHPSTSTDELCLPFLCFRAAHATHDPQGKVACCCGKRSVIYPSTSKGAFGHRGAETPIFEFRACSELDYFATSAHLLSGLSERELNVYQASALIAHSWVRPSTRAQAL